MAKAVKTRVLGARVDDPYMSNVEDYIEAADTNMADLVRSAVDEYIANHPIPGTKFKGEK